jgi:hypothetical protein
LSNQTIENLKENRFPAAVNWFHSCPFRIG